MRGHVWGGQSWPQPAFSRLDRRNRLSHHRQQQSGKNGQSCPTALAALAYWRKIRLEEAPLDTAFGADYDAYRRATWALVPGLF
jgi:hypothetical protein